MISTAASIQFFKNTAINHVVPVVLWSCRDDSTTSFMVLQPTIVGCVLFLMWVIMDWFLLIFTSVLIGCCEKRCLGFAFLNRVNLCLPQSNELLDMYQLRMISLLWFLSYWYTVSITLLNNHHITNCIRTF